jgi:hypothetical protein
MGKEEAAERLCTLPHLSPAVFTGVGFSTSAPGTTGRLLWFRRAYSLHHSR